MDTELATLGQINNDSSSAPATDAPDELCIRDVVRMYVLIYSEEGWGRATAMSSKGSRPKKPATAAEQTEEGLAYHTRRLGRRRQ